jgi:hypothetical protein
MVNREDKEFCLRKPLTKHTEGRTGGDTRITLFQRHIKTEGI